MSIFCCCFRRFFSRVVFFPRLFPLIIMKRMRLPDERQVWDVMQSEYKYKTQNDEQTANVDLASLVQAQHSSHLVFERLCSAAE